MIRLTRSATTQGSRRAARMFAASSLALTLLAGLGLGGLVVTPAFAEEVGWVPEVGSPDSPASTPEPIETVTPPESPEAFANATTADEPFADEPRVYLPGGTSTEPITIRWAGDNPEVLQQYQPDHAALTSDGKGNDAGSGHWNDFRDLTITVSRTAELNDGTVTVTASGMAPMRMMESGGSVLMGTPSNFLQMMQCWGPDPDAKNFAENCQFGGFYDASAASQNLAQIGLYSRPWLDGELMPFRTSSGDVSKPFEILNESGAVIANRDGTEVFFNRFTSNERVLVPIAAGGPTIERFEVQSAAASPHMGCGATPPVGDSRCWLVVVPFGEHSNAPEGTDPTWCSSSMWQPYGSESPFQWGQTLSPRCLSWQDRVVVPLDFENVFSSCMPGSAERQVVGSAVAADALGSWQSTLCNQPGGAAYSLVPNSGNLVRSQLLTGKADFAVVSEPLTAASIGGADPELLKTADIAYAPLANSALVIAVKLLAEDGRNLSADIKLSPRLLAKALTQSYGHQIPHRAAGVYPPHMEKRPNGWMDDPEWAALGNPTPDSVNLFGVLLIGPTGDDAIRALWRYIQADSEAAAYLRGEADPWGLTINPYYLPSGNPAALGGGFQTDLSRDSIDTFPLADQTTDQTTEYGLDSITFTPYQSSFASTAQGVFRVLGAPRGEYNPTGGPLGLGAYESWPQKRSGPAFTVGPTDLANALTYDLGIASLQLPNSNTFISPTDASLTAAVSTMKSDNGVATIDYGTLDATGYPLAITLAAAVDLDSRKLTPEARKDYAGLLRYAATNGNVQGKAKGQLPEGYVPLTASQSAAALALADRLLKSDPATSPLPSQNGATTVTPSTPSNPSAPPGPRSAALPQASAETTPAAGTQGVLGGALFAGVAGLVASPFLLRRRPI